MLRPQLGQTLDFDVPVAPAAMMTPYAVDASRGGRFPSRNEHLAGRPVQPQTLSIVDNGETDKQATDPPSHRNRFGFRIFHTEEGAGNKQRVAWMRVQSPVISLPN
jgi:hypothetical protein